MTREEFRSKWSARRTDWENLGALVSGAKMCEELITDFESVLTSHGEAVLNTNQASAMTGYSRAQLLRQYKDGRLPGHRKGKHVFFRAGDLPRKPESSRPSSTAEATAHDATPTALRKLASQLGLTSAG